MGSVARTVVEVARAAPIVPNMKFLFFVALCVYAAYGQKCPLEGIHYTADRDYCDRYTQCLNGTYSEEQCKDGLVFDDTIDDGRYPCFYPVDVDCGTRTKLQPAQRSGNCLRQNVYFDSGSSNECGYFFQCVDGHEFEVTCPKGLAFSAATYRCEYPEDSPNCDADAFLGFSCPKTDVVEFNMDGFDTYASPRDCRDFFLCVRGNPRIQLCEYGTVFNDKTGACDEPENASSQCQNYYPKEELQRIREEKALRQKRLEERRKKKEQSKRV